MAANVKRYGFLLALLAVFVVLLSIGHSPAPPARSGPILQAHRNPLTEAEVKAHLPSEVVIGSSKKTSATSFGVGTVEEAALAANSVSSAKIATGGVTETDLGSEAVAAAAIKTSAVTAAKLGSEAVEATKLKSEAVETAKIKAEAVTEAKLAAAVVEKFTPGAWKAIELSTKVEAAAGYETPGARLEANGTVVRLRGAVKVKAASEVKAKETAFTIPTGARPKAKLGFGLNTLTSEAVNHLGSLTIETTGVVTDNETVATAGIFFLDGITYNLT